MPTFDYICNKCSKKYESFHWESENPDPCPECGSEDMKRLFSPGNITSSRHRQSQLCMNDLPSQGAKERSWHNWAGTE